MTQIQLPKGGFTPKATAVGGGELGAFFTEAWEQYQASNPSACITDEGLVRGLRLSWYDYLGGLDPEKYKRNKVSQAASQWYKRAKDNPKYIRSAGKDGGLNPKS